MAYQSEIEKLEARYRENPRQWFAALADSYRKAGHLELALDVVRAGLEERPNYVSGHIVLGRCLLDQKNDQEATQAFLRVLELDAENVIALRALADISQRAGDRAGTRRWLTRLLEVDPMNDEAKRELEALEAVELGAVAPEAGPPEGLEPTVIAAPEPAELEVPQAAALEMAGSGGAVTVELEGVEATSAGAEPAPVAEILPPEESAEAHPEPELAIEKAQEAKLGDLEAMEFTPPPETEVQPAQGSDEELAPFDEQLAWGTGERMSRAIDSQVIEKALEVREESLEPLEVLLEKEAVLADLPLILPEEVEGRPVEGAASVEEEGEVAAEPVVTETMAELYAQQGLTSQARDIYRELVAQRPQDARLAGRLAELEQAVLERVPAVKEAKIPLARATGGESVREFLARVLGGGLEGEAELVQPGDNPVGISGSPTRAAEDAISLAAIFGEEPAPLNPATSSGGRGSRSSGFSFDEFFGSGGESEGGESGGGEAGEGDEFTRWLKSLKS
jgi:tetratricopeptide (TPR) repeat protein